jgi:methyl-accepting chemotaxis protein
MRNYAVRLSVDGAEVVERQFQEVGQKGQAAFSGIGQASRATVQPLSAFRGQIQNASFQIGDFATQVGAGTSATVALSQQLPQLLGGFGVFGAVAGAAAAIMLPLGSAFLSAGDEALDFSDATETARSSAERFFDLLRARRDTIAELTEQFGGASAAAERLTTAQIALSAELAQADLNSAIGSLREFAEVGFEFNGLGEVVGRNIGDVQRLAREFSVTRGEVLGLVDEFDRLLSARGAEEQARALQDVVAEIQRMEAAGAEFSSEAAGIVQALLDASAAAETLAANTDSATVSAQRAAAAYREFADEIARADRESKARLEQAVEPFARFEDSRFSNRLTDRDRADVNRARERAAREAERSARGRAGGGGGRGGRSEAEREAEREAKAISDVVEALQNEINLIGQSDLARRIANETRRAGVDVYSEAGQEIAELVIRAESLNDQLERTREINELAASSFSELFAGATRGAGEFEDALGNVLGRLGQMALDNLLLSLLSGVGFGNSALGSAFGTLVGVGRRAYGGPVRAGQPVWVGDGGEPELWVPDTAGTVVPKSRMGGGQMTIVNNVTVQGGDNPRQTGEAVAAGIAASLPALIDMRLAHHVRPGGMFNQPGRA